MEYKLVSVSTAPNSGVFTIHFKSVDGATLDVQVPKENLIAAAPEIQRLCLSEMQKLQAGATEKRGDWAEIPMVEPTKVDIQIAPMVLPPRVCMIFDMQTPWQIAYSLKPDLAEQIAKLLIDRATECKGNPTGMHC
jgi:hypothetical protein